MSDTEELNGSELGTLEHWEKIYDEEINNFQEYGDVGEIWFGKNNAFKLIKANFLKFEYPHQYISDDKKIRGKMAPVAEVGKIKIRTRACGYSFERKFARELRCIEELNISKTDPIIDLGCGNGWTLLKLYENGFKNLLGVDYSPKAVELARNILKENKIVLDDLDTRIEVCDILGDLDSNGKKDTNFLKPRSFKLIHDKGTYDAVSLNPDDRHRQRGKYKTNVWDLLMDDGYLIISSCNWTKDELIQHFSGFKVEKILEAPAIKFGG